MTGRGDTDLDFLKSKNRLGLYLFLLAVLAVGALAAIWSVSGTGAYLTGEGDWQTLAGDYRIGIIDYTVKINDQTLLDSVPGSENLEAYLLDVPILGGVKMFDASISDSVVLTKEFNEGATLVKVRVTNYSKNMVDVTAQFSFVDQRTSEQIAAGVPPIRAMALPVTLTKKTAATFNYRKYILDTLKPTIADSATEAAALTALNTVYTEYAKRAMVLEMGLLPGSTNIDPNVGEDKVWFDQETQTWCYYKDVFLVIWTEYGDGEFNSTVNSAAQPRQGRFDAEFTVGQLD